MLEMTSPQMDDVLADARIGRLCMATPDGQPYVIPMPFCWQDHALYLRIAFKGRKGSILAENPRVCFEVDWCSDSLDDYGSLLIEGRLEAVLDLEEKARIKLANDAKYARLRGGFRPGHGRHTPLVELAMQKIVVAQMSGRIREQIAEEQTTANQRAPIV